MKTAVVIGAGFGGTSAAKGLYGTRSLRTFIISDEKYFVFKPLLMEVATGLFSPKIAFEDLNYLNKKNMQFINAKVTSIDFDKQIVKYADKEIHYDYLVLATGSTTNTFGIKGADKYTYPLYTLKDAQNIKNKLIEILPNNPNIVVCGAGPTGTELAVEIAEFAKEFKSKPNISLVDRSAVHLPMLKLKTRKLVSKVLAKHNVELILNVIVDEIGKDFVNAGDKIKSDMTIWTAGVKPVEINGINPCPNVYLQLRKNVYAIGDCSIIKDSKGKKVPLLAQSAHQAGSLAAHNIRMQHYNKKLREFKFRYYGFIMPFGKGSAVGEIFGVTVSGFIAWKANRFAYWINFMSNRHRIKSLFKWTVGFFKKRDTKPLNIL